MDINDNQQINSFLKGMNTDVSDALIDSSQYRYAENLRLVTNTDSNTGELRLVDGTELVNNNFGEFLALTSVRNKLIALVKENGLSIKVSEDKGVTWKTVVKKLPWSEFDGLHFSLVTRWESDKNVKLYIADGKHLIICINLARIDDNNPYVQPDRDNTLDDIVPYMAVPLEAPHIEISNGSGNLQSVKVQYAYRLYNVGEPASTTSPLSNIISLYKNYNEGYKPEEYTNKAIDITIPSSGNFEKLQVYRITYVILGLNPSVSLIYDGDVISSLTDRGQEVQVMSDVEFIASGQLQMVPKVIESKEDYLFAGNIKYKQDDFDAEIKGLNFRSYSSGDFDGISDFLTYTNGVRDYNKQFDQNITSDISKYNKQYWTDSSGSVNNPGGTGPIVSWKFIHRNVLVDKDNNMYDYPEGTKGDQIKDDLASLRKGEVYRYGIILYKDNGTRSSVHWIADVMVPPDIDIKPIMGYNGWQFDVIGIRFTVNIPSGYNIHGFEIVRCLRKSSDSFTISQGILSVPVTFSTEGDYSGNDRLLFPSGFMTTESMNQDTSEYAGNIPSDYNYLMFASPEIVYLPDDMEDIIKANKSSLYTEDIISFFNPLNPSGRDYSDSNYSGHNIHQFASIGSFGDNQYSLWIKSNEAVGRYNEAHVRLGDRVGTYYASRYHDIHETAITHMVAAQRVGIYQLTSYIDDCAFPEVPDPNHFYNENKVPVWKDDCIPIGDKTFIAWTARQLYGLANDVDIYNDMASTDRDYDGGYHSRCNDPYGLCGKCAIFKLKEERQPLLSQGPQDYVVAPIIISNLRKYALPYNGPSSYKSNGPEYYSHGNYAVSTGSNVMDMWDGDCYPGVFVYQSEHTFNNVLLPNANKSAIIYYVPIESDINLRATYGDLYTRIRGNNKYYYSLYRACDIDGYVQKHDMYLYNTAYNAEANVTSYSTINYTRIDTGTFDTRVHYSDKKTNNESVDSWGTFKANNYLDVDTRFGEITNMRLFKDKLLYWQKDAFGVLSVNERSVINDLSDSQLILGTGGTLQRFDYISTLYGMKKNQYESEIQSNTTQYFWDGIRKEILAYAGGTELVPLSKTKNITNYMNERGEKDKPALIYDNKYNELIASVVGTKSLAYNEQVQAFTSVYLFTPLYRALVDETVILTDNNSVYHWNADSDHAVLFKRDAMPLLKYVVNKNSSIVKVFDITTFGGRFYGGGSIENGGPDLLTFTFDTPLKQHSAGSGRDLITNREYDFRLDIPRNNGDEYGGRMRGKTMQCELKSSSNSNDFSLQYIITKYRMSWS